MKSNYFKRLAGLLLFLSCLCLSSCKIMTPSDYKKAKEVVSSELAQVGLHGTVTINKLEWTALEFPQYHVSYTYSEKTYDGQTVPLEQNTTFADNWSDSYNDHLPEYKKAFLEQKSIKELEGKIEKQLKKQKIGLPIHFISFFGDFLKEEKEVGCHCHPKSKRRQEGLCRLLSDSFSDFDRSRACRYDYFCR